MAILCCLTSSSTNNGLFLFMLVIGDFVLLALYQGQGDPHSRIRVAKHAVVLTLEASLHCFMDSQLACQRCFCSQWGCNTWLAFPYAVQVTVTHSHSLSLSLSLTHTHTHTHTQSDCLLLSENPQINRPPDWRMSRSQSCVVQHRKRNKSY